MRRDDEAVSSVVGAIVVLVVLGTALLYTNAYHVPRQGAAIESAGIASAAEALGQLASDLSAAHDTPIARTLPLQAARTSPPLLAGVVLSPARAPGAIRIADGPNLSVSVVIDAPASGVPANDPIREDLGAGRMRYFLLGNVTSAQPVGALEATLGGAYGAPVEHHIEAGALLASGATSYAVAPPSASVTRAGGLTSLAWRIPILLGSGAVEGASQAQVTLTPGLESEVDGALVYNATIRVETTSLAAWTSALQQIVGSRGFVNATQIGAPDNGTVDALIVAPPGTSLSTRAVAIELRAIRYEVSLAAGAS